MLHLPQRLSLCLANRLKHRLHLRLAIALPALCAALASTARPAPETTAAAASTAVEAVAMSVGEIRMLKVPGKLRRIALGNGAYASATSIDGQIMLIGEVPGQTSMMVWTDQRTQSYQLRVLPPDDADARGVLERLVAASAGQLALQEFDNKLLVTGATRKDTLDQLSSLSRMIPRLVLNVRENREAVRSVLFRLHFIEVNKSLLENLGIQWAGEAPGPTFGAQKIVNKTGIYQNPAAPQGQANLLDPNRPFVSVDGKTSGVFLGLATSIASRLKFSASDGDTRLLASPELTAMSGGKARMQVGGEIPIPLAGAFGAQTVEFKPYGIIFNIEPVIGENGAITAKVSTELSQIDPAVTVAGIPGFLTRMTSTEINVRPGEIVALSGLVNSELSNAIDKVPGLGNIPVLGRLFRSDSFRNKRTELIVLLEPEIVVPGQGMASALLQRGMGETQGFKDKVLEQTRPAPAAAREPYDPQADPALR